MEQYVTKIVQGNESEELYHAFILWEIEDDNQLNVFWGFYGEGEYYNLIFDSNSSIAEDFLRLFENYDTRNFIKIIQILNSAYESKDDNYKSSENKLEIYTELFKQLWNLYENDKISYIPFERVDVLKKWFDILLNDARNIAEKKSIVFDNTEQKLVTENFVTNHIRFIQNEIDKYRNTDEAEVARLRPTVHIGYYLKWLESLPNDYIPNSQDDRNEINSIESNENKILDLANDFRGNFLDRNGFNVFVKIYTRYFNNNVIVNLKPKLRIRRNKKMGLARLLGKIFFHISNSSLTHEYLTLAKNTFECFADERVQLDEGEYLSRLNLFKYMSGKEEKSELSIRT